MWNFPCETIESASADRRKYPFNFLNLLFIMKCSVFVVAVALVMASCSQDETTGINKGSTIRFRTSVERTTRGVQTTLADLGEFKVTAVGNGANYFTDLGVSSSDNGATWTPATVYYWPSYDLDFCAYAPQSLAGVSVSADARTIEDFIPSATVADQQDLLIACNTGSKAVNESSGVSLNFKHALSRISVKAKCMNPDMQVEVLGVKICRVPSTATFTFPSEVTSESYVLPQANWTTPTTPADYVVRGGSAVTLTADAQSIMFGDDGFMLIPQKLTAWSQGAANDGAYLSVLCRISSLDGGRATQLYPVPTDENAGKYAFSAVPIDTDWQPGYHYAYTLEFCGANSGGGLIDPSPTNPADPDDADVDPTPGTGGEEILSEPIRFSVTVDEWKDAAPENMDM